MLLKNKLLENITISVKYSRLKVYEDACELQMYFILERDRLTKDGLRLMTQAVNATQKKVQTEIDVERKAKQQKESQEDADDESDENKKSGKYKFKGVTAIEVVRYLKNKIRITKY